MAPVLIGSGAFNTFRLANSSIYQQPPSVRCYVASTGRRIAIIEDASGNLTYRTSADGVTWASSATLVTAATGMGGSQYISDTLYWFGWDPGTTTTTFYKSAFNTGTFAFAAPTTVNLGTGLGSPPNMVWDSTNSVFHTLYAIGSGVGLEFVSINTSGSVVKTSSVFEPSTNLWPAIAGVLCIPGATATVYAVYFNGASALCLKPATYTTAGGYVLGTEETVVSGTYSGSSYAACALDNSNNVDIVYSFPGTSLNAIRRTGTNTYGGSTSLVASGVPTVRTPSAINLTTDGSGGLLVTYPSTANQANGEIYGVWRPSGGAWGAPGLIAGGASTGFQSPRASATMASARTDILYTDGTGSTGNTYYVSYLTGTTPNTPTNSSPASSAFVSTLTPSFAWNYSNNTPTDTQSQYEIIVTRVSDSVVMWDSTAVSSSAASGIVYGGTGSPTALSFGIQYKWKVRVADTVLSSFSAYSTETTFTPAAAGVASLTAVAGSAGAAASTVKTSTLANATSLPVQTGDGAKFTVGQQIAVGTSPTIDIVTISSKATDTLTVTAMAHAHTATTDAVVEADSTVTLGAPTGITATWAWNQSSSDAANAYTLTLYQSDGVTLVATTSGSIGPTEAAGASQTSASWSPAGLANSTTYKLSVTLTDATTSIQATSPQMTVNTSWTPPGAPSAFTVTPTQNSGWMQLAWTNAGSIASVNVLRRPTGGSTWTTISSGTLIAALKDLCPLNTAFDYGVQSVNSLGVPSTITTVTNKTLTVTNDGLGYWFCDVTAPTTTSVVLGGDLSQTTSGTQLHHNENVLRYVPQGRKRPIASYGLDDWWDAPGRIHYVPTSGNSATYGAVIAAMESLSQTHAICLYRDPIGRFKFVFIENLTDYAGDGGLDAYLQFDLFENDYSATVVTA